MKSSSTSITKVIRVLIADDHPVVREGLVTILQSEKDIEVVAEAADGKETCELYNELAPDVLILDLRMPEKDGLQVITELMSHGAPKPRIIVMTTYESEGDVRRALKAGAKGYLVKGQIPSRLGKLFEILPQDAEDRQAAHAVEDILGAAGYEHYETSAFARPERRTCLSGTRASGRKGPARCRLRRE